MTATDQLSFRWVLLAALVLPAVGACSRRAPVTPSALVENGALPFALEEGYLLSQGRSPSRMDYDRGEFHREWHYRFGRVDETPVDPHQIAEALETWIGESVEVTGREPRAGDRGGVSAVLRYQSSETAGTATYNVRSCKDGSEVEVDVDVTEEARDR